MPKGFSSVLHSLGWGMDDIGVQGALPWLSRVMGGWIKIGGVYERGKVGGEDVSQVGSLTMELACGGVPEDGGAGWFVMILENEPVGVLGFGC